MQTRIQRPATQRFNLLVLALSAGAGAGMAVALQRFPEYALFVLGGFLAVGPLIAVALTHFHALTFLAFALLGIVRWEPAPVDLLVLLLLGVGLLAGALAPTQLSRSSLIHAGLWCFGLINLIALLVADDLAYSLRYTAITFYLIAFSYLVKLYITSATRMRLVLLGYLCGALLSVTLVGLELLRLIPTREFFVFETRARALFKDANVFAPFLVLPIMFLLDELLRPELLPGRYWPKVLAVVALSGGVFVAFSRAAWANLVLVIGIYLFLMLPALSFRQWLRLILPGVVGSVALAALVIQLDLLAFLRMRATPLQSYDSDRFGTQAQGIEAGLSHLFGIGPGMLFDAHSLYVRTFAEYGIFGFVALMSVLCVPLIGCLRRALQADDRVYGLSARVVAACWIGLLLNGLVIDTIHWRGFWVLFALCWIMAWEAPTARKRS